MEHTQIKNLSRQPLEKACGLTRDGTTISPDDLRVTLETLQSDAQVAHRALVAAMKKNRRIIACCDALLSQLKDLSLQS